jgi:hypothetical protein
MFWKTVRRLWERNLSYHSSKRARMRRRSCRLDLEQLEERTVPAVVHFIGGIGGHSPMWSDPLNWDTGQPPGPSDDALIGVTGITIYLDGDVTVHSLQTASPLGVNSYSSLTLASVSSASAMFYVGGTLTLEPGAQFSLSGSGMLWGTYNLQDGSELELAGGSFLVGGGSQVSGPGVVRVDGGTMDVEGPVSADTVELDPGGELTGPGELTGHGTFTWVGGTMSGMGATTIASDGTLRMTGDIDKPLEGRTLNNGGVVQWSGSGDLYANSATVNNQAGGLWNIQEDESVRDATGGSVFNNDGTLQKSGGSGTSTIESSFATDGTVEVDAGTLSVIGGGTVAGSFHITAADATFAFAAGDYLVNDTAFDGSGITVIGGGVASQAVTNYIIAPGKVSLHENDTELMPDQTIGGAGTFRQLKGTLTWTGGRMQSAGRTEIKEDARMEIRGPAAKTIVGRNITNFGTVTWTEGDIRFLLGEAPSIIYNMNRFNASGGVQMRPGVGMGVGAFINSDTGTFSVQQATTSGTIIKVAFENRGTVQVVEGGQLELAFGGLHTGVMKTAAGGIVRFTGKIAEFRRGTDPNKLQGAGWYVLDGGSIEVTSGPVIADQFQLAKGDLFGGVTFEAHVFWWTGGSMGGTASAPMGITQLQPGDVMTIDWTVALGNRKIQNSGTIIWEGSTINVSNGGTIITDGAFEAHSNPSGSGQLIKNARSDAGAFVVRNGGTFSQLVDEYLGGTTIEMPFQNDGGSVRVERELVLTQDFKQTAGKTLVVNGGDLEIQGTTEQVGLSGGEIDVNGTLGFTAGFFSVTGGALNLNGGTVNGGENQLQIGAGGVLAGWGTINAQLFNDGYMSVTGVLAVTKFRQDSGTLNIFVWGSPYASSGRVDVSTTATLDGTLKATLVSGTPGSDAFPFLTFQTRYGDFANKQLDLGGGLSFDILYNANDLSFKLK